MDMASYPDDAGVKIYPAHPALDPDSAQALCTALDKLLKQFVREGRISDGMSVSLEDGAFILVAWVNTGEGMSGCRKDKMAKVVSLHGERHGCDLLAPPPIWLKLDDTVTSMMPLAFKDAVVAGQVDEQTPAWDTMADTLGSWRQGDGSPLSTIPWLHSKLERIKKRMQAGGT